MAQQLMTQLAPNGTRVQSLALLNGFRIWCCRELLWRLHMRLGSSIAVAVAQASTFSSNSTPSLGTFICHGHGPKKTKKKNSTKNHSVLCYFVMRAVTS